MSKNPVDKLKVFLSRIPFLRLMALKLLRLISRDITIHNPYTRDRLFLNLYHHKGYWYFGRSRERATMEKFRKLIPAGSVVVEIGGHIGYISQYFSMLVGEAGKVIVFEPGSNNLPYTEANLKSRKNVYLVKKAISDKLGEAIFYEDNITGQNNSLLSEYKNADSVSKSHSEKLVKHKRVVQVTTLDNYLDENDLVCDFIKIDIEGFELNALRGMSKTLQKCKSLMIEVTENQEEVSQILMANQFSIEDEDGNKMAPIPSTFNGNIFALKFN
jgi:FkbM family methyltransferase